MNRASETARKTRETQVRVEWKLDGEGSYHISTGIPFFNHMLELFARHGFFDLTIEAKGDIDIDYHHTIEDTGITLGKALREALPAFEGIRRYGHSVLPMDESLCMVAIDMSGRPCLVWNGDTGGKLGSFDGEVVKEFFQGFVNEARVTLHVNLLYGENLHHRIEAIFKGFGRALREAVATDEKVKGALSTKGIL
ncbi:MAG: Imidazoleglycerol-phosphate dehydratase [Syntrophorhabdaceae bacterium PtaU1.Bin034]|jgi:imidazoleglycerol-phosphate dehydratase|nr:MAG: Imidazoleglycerol-phosphate dehydratase [Syntrophorhabdaceae bacterium PtaU1.Bin034]